MLPPVVLRGINRLRSGASRPDHSVPQGSPLPDALPEWQYVPEGWRAVGAREGWMHDSIAVTQRRKWAEFAAALEGTGPLGLAHEAPKPTQSYDAHNLVMSFGYVLARAARDRARLSVLDWGGGLGHYAVFARALLPEMPMDYAVHDVPRLCASGRDLLPWVSFSSDEATTFTRSYDLVVASSSIQYAEDWRDLIAKLARAGTGWVFLTRVPVVHQTNTYVVVQRPHAYGYLTEYISWVFNRAELLAAAAAAGLALDREMLVNERPPIMDAPEPSEGRGFLFRVQDGSWRPQSSH